MISSDGRKAVQRSLADMEGRCPHTRPFHCLISHVHASTWPT